jgi:hypothetical protein
LPHVGNLGLDGPGRIGAFFIAASGQTGETLLFEDQGDGRGGEPLSLMGQGAADVIDGQVLLSQGDDPLKAVGIPLAGTGLPAIVDEETPLGILAEAVDENAEAAGAVAKAPGGLIGGQALDDEGSEGLVLAMGGVGGLEEAATESYQIIRLT